MKFKILVAVVVFAFIGCANNTASSKPVRGVVPGKVDETRAYSNKLNTPSAFNINNCRDVVGCKDLADNYYASGDFSSAIQAYDANCVNFLHIPSCVKAASMFEKGEGVQINLNTAFVMYRASCYHGNQEGCKGKSRVAQKLK